MGFGYKLMSILDPIGHPWDADPDDAQPSSNSSGGGNYVREGMGFKQAEAAEAPSGYGNPSTYTPGVPVSVGNPSTYTPSNPEPNWTPPVQETPAYVAPATPVYTTPSVAPAVEAPPVQTSDIDRMREEWASNIDNLIAAHNGNIANAKNEYELAERHGNMLGMQRAAQKALEERQKAMADGTFNRLHPLLISANSGSYADYIRAIEQEEAENLRKLREQHSPKIRDYAGYDSKSSDTSRNRYASSVSGTGRGISLDERKRYGKG